MKKQYINFLKFISILMVICIHIISKTWLNSDVNSNTFKILTIIDCICRICVPLFVMCSGAIFLNRNDKISKIYLKYISKIYLIYVLFNFIYKTINHIIYTDDILNVNSLLIYLKDSIFLKSIYHLWYLEIVLIIYATIPLFKFFINKNKKYIDNIILILLFLTFQILPIFIDNIHFLNFVNFFGYTTYFFLGYYLQKYNYKHLNIILFILSILAYIYSVTNTINISIKFNYHAEEYMQYLSINVLIMSCFIFNLCKCKESIFNKEKIKNFLNFESKYNFKIYLLHGLVIGFLSYIKIIDVYSYENFFKLIIYILLVYIVSFISSYLLDLFIKLLIPKKRK